MIKLLFPFFFLFFNFQIIYADSYKILFLGDTHFGENYQINSKFNGGQNVIEEYGYDYFFKNVKDLLLSSDFNIANLETPLSVITKLYHEPYGDYIHFSNKDKTSYYLSKYNIKAVSIANNHILDLQFDGLNCTISSLNNYGITSFGAGTNEEEASAPFTKTFIFGNKKFEIYVFGCYWYRNRFDTEKNYYADKDKGGVNLLDTDKISERIKKLKKNNPDAFTVIYPHWGSNYKVKNDYQSSIAHSLIDYGVDLIIGHGAHTIQEIECYHGKWIVYNIGNFIFNSPGRYGLNSAKPYGLIAELKIDNNQKSLKLYPIYTNNLETNYQIRFLEDDEYDDCYSLIACNSGIKKIKDDKYKYFEILIN